MGGGGGHCAGHQPPHGKARQGPCDGIRAQHCAVRDPGAADRGEEGRGLPPAGWLHAPGGAGRAACRQGPGGPGASEQCGAGPRAGADLPRR